MPIANIQDAREVEGSLQAILYSTDADTAAQAIRTLFVETLDFDYDDRLGAAQRRRSPTCRPTPACWLSRDGISACCTSRWMVQMATASLAQ